MANYHRDYAFLMEHHYSDQAEIIATAISKLSFPAMPSFTFVDIGSHEGKLTRLVLADLAQDYPVVKAHCIEPDKETFQILQSNIDSASFYNTDFQSWLRDTIDGVDLMVNSHTFYHYPESTWTELLYGADRLLTKDGQHVIILDSATSSLIKMRPILRSKIPEERHDAFGRFIDGSDLENQLTSMKYIKRVLPSPVHFKNDDKALDGVCYMLGFVMRYEPEDVKRYAKEEVKDFIEQHKKGDLIVFPRDQDFFALPKQ